MAPVFSIAAQRTSCKYLLIFNEIVVELKAVKILAPEHEAQLFNYMRISKKKIGYLVDLGASKDLAWKRFAL